ncbi:MAG: histidinol-phosphate transaminase [Clostridiales bacterium]|nr:histidinol-phosphate transaminase [Clostridiales bacterium]
MSNYWNKKINSIEPYVAGEQPAEGVRVIKLNTNENPYPPSPACQKALEGFDIASLRLYPNTDAMAIKEAAARAEGVAPENIFVGNGSDEVLALVWQTYWEKEYDQDKAVLVPEISYSFYPVYSDFYSVRCRKVPLRDGFAIDAADYIGVPNCGIAIANPNAPTSRVMPLEDIEKILKANPDSVVMIDEAYQAFAEDYVSAVSLIGKYKNLIVVKTMSKAYSLAGLRVGYAIGDKELIEGLLRARDSFNSYPVDRLAQVIAAAALDDRSYYEETRKKIIATRKRIAEELKTLGFTMPESGANFLFAKPPVPLKAETLYKNLKAKGILVRYFNKPLIGDYLRITIGTDDEMDEFIRNVREEIDNAKNS